MLLNSSSASVECGDSLVVVEMPKRAGAFSLLAIRIAASEIELYGHWDTSVEILLAQLPRAMRCQLQETR
jgi:hypothetical protein